jgi:hypothetical protein
MKEQSQIDAMRAAVRGDLERYRARTQPSPVVQPDPDDAGDRLQPVAETEPDADARDTLQPVPEPQEEPRPGIFSGLFRRR